MSGPVASSAERRSDLGGELIAGAGWMVAMRWTMQALGMVNTLVLVRLLSPEDFGLVAMAMIVVAFVNSFNEIGMDMALIRLPVLSESHYHTAWTLAVSFALLNSTLLVLCAPAAASFYGDSRLEGVFYGLAAIPLLNGLANTRLVDFRRDLDFARDFRFNVISRSLGLPLTVGLALVLRNYWALVAGMAIQAATSLVVGYIMRPYRPRICFREARGLLGFSVWVQVRSVGGILGHRLDQLYIGKLLGARDIGGYQVSQDITEMATVEVVLPLGRALLPGYARMVGQEERMRSAFYRVMEVHIVLAFALAGGLFVVSGDLVRVLLGEQWVDFVSVFETLAWAGGVAAILSATGPLLVTLGEMRLVALSVWLRFALSLVGLALAVAISGSLLAIAISRLTVMIALLALLVGFALNRIRGSAIEIAALSARPLLACGAMIAAIRYLQGFDCCAPWLRLFLEVPLGATVYSLCLLLLWMVWGRPPGAMQEILARLVEVARQRFIRAASSGGSA